MRFHKAIRQCKGKRKSLLVHRLDGVDVLQILEGRMSRRKNFLEEGGNISSLQGRFGIPNSFVFAQEMDRAQKCAVAKLLTDFCRLRKKLRLGDAAKHLFSKQSGNRLHLSGNRGIILIQIGMIAARIHNAKHISLLGKRCLNGLDHGLCGIGKVNENKAANGTSRLIHEAAGLAEENILGVLRNLRDLHIGNRTVIIQIVHHVADHHLKGRRGGNTASLQNLGGAVGIKTANGMIFL